MIEIRIHGRGGQGAVVASKVLAEAAFLEGHYVQAYPQYGVERRGAPVVSFTRVAEPGDEFFVRQDILEPDHLVVLDPTLLSSTNVVAGLKKNGWIIVNSPDPPDSLGIPPGYRVATVNASEIAVRHGIGSRTQPVVNTTVLGAFARVTGLVKLDSLLRAIEEEAPTKTEENKSAAREAYESVNTGGTHA